MNKWQKQYCDEYYKGKTPRDSVGKEEFTLLGDVRSHVCVSFPAFKGLHGETPAHDETYEVTLTECDMPNGKISARVLAANLRLWLSRGYAVKTF